MKKKSESSGLDAIFASEESKKRIVIPSSEELSQIYDLWEYNFPLWAEYSGIKVDGYSFSFKGHNYLLPLYWDRSLNIALMKSAQMGATVWMLLKAFHMSLYPEAWGFNMPIKVGFYFPNRDGVNLTVKGRVEPMMNSTPYLQPYAGEKSRQWKPVGDSALYFLYMGGDSSKDSTPLMSVLFDEVRLMDLSAIDQAEERVAHSPLKYKLWASTAGYPKGDIHSRFLDSDQKWFHTECPSCGHEQILAQTFPDCIAEHTIGPRRGQVYYICQKCRSPITNTQKGRYIPHGDPRHEKSGYHISQLISHRISAREILEKFRNTDNIKEFWNAKLGMPYVDAENRPVTIEFLKEGQNINPLMEWGKPSGKTFMGIDQMTNLIYVVILEIRGEERRVVWFEIIEDSNPWKRCGQLMDEFDVETCVCSYEPNTDKSLEFANSFPKRVFLGKEGGYEDMQRWVDDWKPKKALRRADPESYYKYRVFIDKYQSIGRTLKWIVDGRIRWPHPRELIQEVAPLGGGRVMPQAIWETHAYPHFASAVRHEEVTDKAQFLKKYTWKFIGLDPHSLDALNFAVTASLRKRRYWSF